VAMSVVVAVACVAARVLARGQGHGGRRGQDDDGALWEDGGREDGGREEGGGAAGMEGAAMVKGQRNASWRGRKRLMSPAGVVQAAQPWQAAASVHGEDGRSIGGFQSLSVFRACRLIRIHGGRAGGGAGLRKHFHAGRPPR
jgi:hypothetical protein